MDRLGGAGSNSTIIAGKTSVIVLDAKQTEAGAKNLLTQIAKITPNLSGRLSVRTTTVIDADHPPRHPRLALMRQVY